MCMCVLDASHTGVDEQKMMQLGRRNKLPELWRCCHQFSLSCSYAQRRREKTLWHNMQVHIPLSHCLHCRTLPCSLYPSPRDRCSPMPPSRSHPADFSPHPSPSTMPASSLHSALCLCTACSSLLTLVSVCFCPHSVKPDSCLMTNCLCYHTLPNTLRCLCELCTGYSVIVLSLTHSLGVLSS